MSCHIQEDLLMRCLFAHSNNMITWCPQNIAICLTARWTSGITLSSSHYKIMSKNNTVTVTPPSLIMQDQAPGLKIHYFSVIQNILAPAAYFSFCLSSFWVYGPEQLRQYSDSVRAGRSGDQIPVGVIFSAPVQTGPGAHPASYIMGTGSSLEVKWLGRGVDHPPPSIEVNVRVELHLYSPFGPSWPVLGWTLPLIFHLHSGYVLVLVLNLINIDIYFVVSNWGGWGEDRWSHKIS